MAKILVVDDSAVDRRFVGGLLQREPTYLIEFAEDGAEALAKVRQSPPDVIVTDLQMPNRNGLELVSAVRMHHAGIPIILMTGHGSEGLAVEALQRGASGYVPKPHLGDRLLDAVGESLLLAQADHTYERLIACLDKCNLDFELENDPDLIGPLIDMVQQMVAGMRLTDATGRFRIGTAVKEALLNGLFRGNLELPFIEIPNVRDDVDVRISDIIEARRGQQPYCDRRLVVQIQITPEEARFCIRDGGTGFDPSKIPGAGGIGSLDPQIGRGMVLMRAFMDDVVFNEEGNEITLVKRREGAFS